MREYYVYIMTNRSRTLYTGVTNDLRRRAVEHKSGAGGAFTSKYRIDLLVYYETFPEALQAIAAEKRIKGWTRAKKIALIESKNPQWDDLADGWYGPTATGMQPDKGGVYGNTDSTAGFILK